MNTSASAKLRRRVLLVVLAVATSGTYGEVTRAQVRNDPRTEATPEHQSTPAPLGPSMQQADPAVAKVARPTGRCDPNVSEKTDLAGTYTGLINYPGGGVQGKAQLTIFENNTFQITGGPQPIEGRVSVVTTCNYTSAALMFGDSNSVSVRVSRFGGRFGLSPLPGKRNSLWFRCTRPPCAPFPADRISSPKR